MRGHGQVGTKCPKEYQPQLPEPLQLQLRFGLRPGLAGLAGLEVSTLDSWEAWVLKGQRGKPASSKFTMSCLSAYSCLNI